MFSIRLNDAPHPIRGLNCLRICWSEVVVEKIKRLFNNFLRESDAVRLVLKGVQLEDVRGMKGKVVALLDVLLQALAVDVFSAKNSCKRVFVTSVRGALVLHSLF